MKKKDKKKIILSDIFMIILFFVGIVSILTFNSIIILITMIIAFWLFYYLIFYMEYLPHILAQKLGKCPYCGSKSVKFYSWDFPLAQPLMLGFLKFTFRMKCEKCQKIFDMNQNIKMKLILSILMIIGAPLPIIIYGILMSIVGFFEIDVTKIPLLFIPIGVLFSIYFYFRLSKKF